MAQLRIKLHEKEVTKIITAGISATISKHWQKGHDLQYIGMIVATDAAAPTLADMETNGFDLFANGENQCQLQSDTSVDVYVFCNKEDTKADFGWLVVTI